jgi:hypothetical protein
MINELERVWKEVAVPKFKVLSQHFPEGTKKKKRKTSARIAGLRDNI